MTIPAWAKVGAKVVAINDSLTSYYKKGDVLTISNVEISTARNIAGEIEHFGFHFLEIETPKYIFAWAGSKFRPVQTKTVEQDIEIFAPLLNTKDEKELIDG